MVRDSKEIHTQHGAAAPACAGSARAVWSRIGNLLLLIGGGAAADDGAGTSGGRR